MVGFPKSIDFFLKIVCLLFRGVVLANRLWIHLFINIADQLYFCLGSCVAMTTRMVTFGAEWAKKLFFWQSYIRGEIYEKLRFFLDVVLIGFVKFIRHLSCLFFFTHNFGLTTLDLESLGSFSRISRIIQLFSLLLRC